MSIPTAPTAVSICTEGLRKAGVRSPIPQDMERARTEWLEEIKADIWAMSKTLTALQSEKVSVVVNGQGRYPNPTDYSSAISLVAMHGEQTGAAQAGSVSTITLAAAYNDTDGASTLGRKFVITAGTGKSSSSQCVGWNNTTKVATMTPNWDTAPEAGSTYMRIDIEYPLTLDPIFRYDTQQFPTTRGIPCFYSPLGDADNGEFVLRPVPDKTYAMRMRYYADLTRLDLAGTRIATLYRRWRTALVDGIAARAVAPDDKRYKDLQKKYTVGLGAIIQREAYGLDLSNLVSQVGDYG